MKDRIALTRRAIRTALRIRREAGFTLEDPICIYDCAKRLGVEVRFVSAPSLEGMYASSGSGVIIVSSLRPSGRQAYTCAHELGHHVFGHGSKWDEYLDESGSNRPEHPDEWLAERFASYILMPKQAVLRSFVVRGWIPSACTFEQAFLIAGELGVGYSTLISQMQWSLGLLDDIVADRLRRESLGAIRRRLVGHECREHLVVVDIDWFCRPNDIKIGDEVLLPQGTTITGNAVRVEGNSSLGVLVQGHRPGIAQASQPNQIWARFIRVSRREYVGRAAFRHLEDPDDA